MAENKQPVQVTREELYRQVWETPMTRLAETYGITGNGLAKICDRLNVPYPPRGYWARKAAGQNVVTFKLPVAGADTALSARIAPTVKPVEGPPTAENETITALQGTIGEIAVPERLYKPHPIIEAWLADHKRRTEEARSDPWRHHWSPAKFTDSEKRRHRVLDALFKALEKRGGKVSQDKQAALQIEVQKQKIEIQLREKLKQVKRPPTEDEKKYRSADKNGFIRENQPSGLFAFSIKTRIPNVRREWLEGKGRTMESFLPEIVATLVAAGPILEEMEKLRAEEAHRRHVAEMKAHEGRQRKKKTENRWWRFVKIAKMWRDVQLAREFVAAIKATPSLFDKKIEGQDVDEWLAWIEQQASEFDPLARGTEAIFNTVAQANEWTSGD